MVLLPFGLFGVSFVLDLRARKLLMIPAVKSVIFREEEGAVNAVMR